MGINVEKQTFQVNAKQLNKILNTPGSILMTITYFRKP